MNNKVRVAVAGLALLSTITGCEKRIDSSCSSSDAQDLIGTIIRNQAEKPMLSVKDKNGELVFSAEQIKESLTKFVISIENVRTTNKDPNSTKASCAGTLVINTPQEMLIKVDKARIGMKIKSIYDHAKSLDISFNQNKFSSSIEYYVQPTDDGKSIYAALEKSSALSSMLEEIATSYLLEPVVVEKEKEAAEPNKSEEKLNINAKETPTDQCVNNLIEEFRASDFAKDREAESGFEAPISEDMIKEWEEDCKIEENLKLSKNQAMRSTNESAKKLIGIWDSAPDDFKNSILQEQQEWNKNSEKDCRLKATTEEINNADKKDIIYFNCLEAENNKRAELLKQKIDSLAKQNPSIN